MCLLEQWYRVFQLRIELALYGDSHTNPSSRESTPIDS
jgi:hypothetical protein